MKKIFNKDTFMNSDNEPNNVIATVNPLNTLQNVKQLTNKQLQTINKTGLKIYKDNDFMKNIFDIMEDGKLKQFMDKYIHNKSDVNMMMIYFNLYSMIENQFQFVFNRKIQKGEMLYFMKECMSNKIMRKFAIHTAHKYTDIESDITKMIKDSHNKSQNHKHFKLLT